MKGGLLILYLNGNKVNIKSKASFNNSLYVVYFVVSKELKKLIDCIVY